MSEQSELLIGNGAEKLPENVDRRHCLRHPVRFGYIELGKHNGGIVLNISEGGLALQAARGVMNSELPRIRFQFRNGGDWIESSGRIAWTSPSKKMVGISFVDLQDKSRSVIRAWVSSDDDRDKNDESTNTGVVKTTDSSLVEPGDKSLTAFNQNLNENSGDPEIHVVESPVIPHVSQQKELRVEIPPSNRASFMATTISKIPQRHKEGNTFSWTKSDWLIGTGVLILIGLLTVSLLEMGKRTAAFSKVEVSGEGHMGLKLDRSGEDLRLSWNPDAPVISSATKGRLLITDGNSRKFLDLDPSDLRGGTMVYTPSTNDVVLRLEVDRRDSPVAASESVRISSGQPMSSPNDAAHRIAGIIRTGSLLIEPKLAAPPASNEGAMKPTAGTRGSELAKGQERKTQQGSASNILASGDKLAAHPIMKSRSDFAIPAPPSAVGLLSSGPSVVVTPSVIPVPRQPLQSSNGFEAAQLVSKRDPIYPASARESHFTGMVELHFRVDADGRVHDIAVVKGNPILVTAAVSAVQSWRYKPAKLNGAAVETEASAIVDFK